MGLEPKNNGTLGKRIFFQWAIYFHIQVKENNRIFYTIIINIFSIMVVPRHSLQRHPQLPYFELNIYFFIFSSFRNKIKIWKSHFCINSSYVRVILEIILGSYSLQPKIYILLKIIIFLAIKQKNNGIMAKMYIFN